MKLFIVAALVSVASAARLEHLERGYLPPDHSHGQAGFGSQGSHGQTFGSQGSLGSGAFGSGSFGSQGSFGASSFDSNVIDSAATRSQGFGSASSFPEATSNQYLPPNHGPSGSNGQFSGSLSGFQRSQYTPQSFGGANQHTPNQYGSASNGFAQSRYQNSNGGSTHQHTPNQFGSASNGFAQSRYQNSGSSQFPATSNQYLTPKSSFQNIPQQAFDEQTGYHY